MSFHEKHGKTKFVRLLTKSAFWHFAQTKPPEAAKEPFALVAQKLLEKEVEAILADETIQKVHLTCILGMCGYQIVTDLKT